jgi:hypothetical protein
VADTHDRERHTHNQNTQLKRHSPRQTDRQKHTHAIRKSHSERQTDRPTERKHAKALTKHTQ